MLICLFVSFHLSKNRSKLISGIIGHPGHLHGVGVNSTYPALQKINSGRSTARAFPFLCDLDNSDVEGGLETASNLLRWNRFVSKTQKVEPLFMPKPLNPLLNPKVFHTSAEPNAAVNAQPVRRSAGSTLQRGSSCTHPLVQSCLCWCEGVCANESFCSTFCIELCSLYHIVLSVNNNHALGKK